MRHDWVSCKIFSTGGQSLEEKLMNLLWSWFNFCFRISQNNIKKYSRKSYFYLLPPILVSPFLPRPSTCTYLLHNYLSRVSLCKYNYMFSLSCYYEVFYEWDNYNMYAYETCEHGILLMYLQCLQQSCNKYFLHLPCEETEVQGN